MLHSNILHWFHSSLVPWLSNPWLSEVTYCSSIPVLHAKPWFKKISMQHRKIVVVFISSLWSVIDYEFSSIIQFQYFYSSNSRHQFFLKKTCLHLQNLLCKIMKENNCLDSQETKKQLIRADREISSFFFFKNLLAH